MLEHRDEMLAAMAHEVRQPLNNASAALQSATSSLMSSPHGIHEQALLRLQRAQTVLSQVTASIDNTLADAVLLNDKQLAVRQDIDVDMFVDLVIGDFDSSGKSRIHRTRSTDVRTVSMHAGLMHLALRNLLANALAYTPPYSPIEVHIADTNDPLDLVIEVRDLGAGISEDLLPKLFTRGARGSSANQASGHGLGLHIVRRIMQMHGGKILMRPNQPKGLIMALVIPQSLPQEVVS